VEGRGETAELLRRQPELGLQRRGQDRGLQGQEMQAEATNKAAMVEGFAKLGGAAVAMSDRSAKTAIRPLSGPAERGSASNSWVGGTQMMVRDPEHRGRLIKAGGGEPSMAEKFKRELFGDLEEAGTRGTDFGAAPVYPTPHEAESAVRSAPAYEFRYKDPGRYGEGLRVGQMANDLEKTPAGAAAVLRTPEGKRAVDTGELSTINTAALYGQQQRQDNLEEELRKLRQGFGFELPEADTDALDESYAAERARR